MALGCATGLVNSKMVGLLTSPQYRLDDIHALDEDWDSGAANA
jgi:hypothetical protein